jgi:hypothetical protein
MGSQPGDDPEIPAKPVGPGLLSGISDKLESGIHVQGTPLVIGYVMPVEMKDLVMS